MKRGIAALLCLFLCADTLSHDEQDARAHYIANAGVMIVQGETRVLFDPLFRLTHDYYDSTPPDIEAALLAGEPPYDGIDAVFISHYHGDHFDPELIAALLRNQASIHLYAPEQAASAIRDVLDDSELLPRIHGLDSADYQLAPLHMRIDQLHIDAIRIPHAGWPTNNWDVENLAYRVTLNDSLTVMHLGDADADLRHFTSDAEFWRERQTHLALPPFWLFLSEDGRAIVDDIVRATQTIGVHVSNDIPDEPERRAEELQDVDLFVQPGETRQIR